MHESRTAVGFLFRYSSFFQKEKGENDQACQQLVMILGYVFSVNIFFGRFGAAP